MLARIMFLLVALLAADVRLAALSAAEEEPKSVAKPEQIRAWIEQLASDDYAVREAASVELVARGPKVLDAIAEIKTDDGATLDTELLWRTVHIVQQIAMSGDIDLLDRSIAILERLRKAAPSGGSAILGTDSASLRDRFRVHAQQQIVELGGAISGSHLGGGLAVELGPSFKGSDKHLRYLKVLGPITYVRLTGEKFNDASLEHLKGLSELKQLHLTETAVTSKGQKALEEAIADINILRFGPAVIGIAGVTHSGHCLVQSVQPGTGAANGGLQPGDMITKLDGTKVEGFEDLVGIVAEKKVDQEVKVEVLRAGKKSEHLVTLTRRPANGQQNIYQLTPYELERDLRPEP
jgi:hypothetical protein